MHLHVILLFSINLLQPTITASAPTNETNRLALIKFKESITHDPDMMLSSWNDSMHFCNWFGITCGRRHQRVTVLDLQGYKLRGSMSPHISNLTLGSSISETIASMAKSHMRSVICFDCKRSILTITHWKVKYHPSYPTAPMLES